MNDNFNIQTWKQKFYLNEEQSGTHKLSSLTWDKVQSMLPDQSYSNGLAFPKGTDSMSVVKNDDSFEMWKELVMDKFGDVDVKFNPSAPWHSIVKIADASFSQATKDSESSKQSFLDRGKGSLDETSKKNLSEADKEKLKAKIKEQIQTILKEQDDDYERMSREVEYGISSSDDDYSDFDDLEDTYLDSDYEEMGYEFEDSPIDEQKKDEEGEEDEEIEAEIEDVPLDEPSTPQSGLSAEEQEVQNSLKIAYDNAVSMGDQKLADQIGNSITFFTRTHIVER